METARQTLLTAILETAVDAIIVIDQRGVMQEANPATEVVFGYSMDHMIGRNINMLMPSPYHEEHDHYLANYLRTGERKIIGIGREALRRRQDGSTFPMHLAVNEIVVGEERLLAGIVRDITDLKAAQRQLTEVNEALEDRIEEATRELRAAQAELVQKEKLAMLGQISGGIAHEIRNPLNAVKTSVYYLLNAHNLSPEKTQEHLDRIDRQVTMINNVVTALSDVARLPEPNAMPCDLLLLLEAVLATTSMDRNIHVQLTRETALPPVQIDPNQIPIVFRNLVRNARDAMPEGGRLSFSSEVNDNMVTVHVSDTGSGIAPDQLAKITEPFFSTKARGMGLGLAISKAIVEKNGGELTVVSEVGKGTTFSVRLPRARSSG